MKYWEICKKNRREPRNHTYSSPEKGWTHATKEPFITQKCEKCNLVTRTLYATTVAHVIENKGRGRHKYGWGYHTSSPEEKLEFVNLT